MVAVRRTKSHGNMSVNDGNHEWKRKHKCPEISKDFHDPKKFSRVVIWPGKQHNHRDTQHPVDEAYAYKVGVR